MKTQKSIWMIIVLVNIVSPAIAIIADFDELLLGPESCWNGDDSSGAFERWRSARKS